MPRRPHYQTKWEGDWKLLRFNNKANSISYKFERKVVYGGKSLIPDHKTLALARVSIFMITVVVSSPFSVLHVPR